jgi:hypothetical protein
VDAWVGPYVGLALHKLAHSENKALRDQLALVVACALHYNPLLALQALQVQGPSAASSSVLAL